MAKDSHKETFPVYGEKCLWCRAVHNRAEKFSEQGSKVAVDERPGRPVDTAAGAIVQRVEELIRAERRISIHRVATVLGRIFETSLTVCR